VIVDHDRQLRRAGGHHPVAEHRRPEGQTEARLVRRDREDPGAVTARELGGHQEIDLGIVGGVAHERKWKQGPCPGAG
jgi:hypothetical protein